MIGLLCTTINRAMAQAVSSVLLTAEARFQSRLSPRGICGGQSDTGTGFSPSAWVSFADFIQPVLQYTEKRRN
jgi:hypothetical protein